MVLESKLLKLSIIKGAEFRRQPTKAPDKPELCGNDVNDSTEPSLLGKLQAILDCALDLRERISRSEQVRVQGVAAVGRNCEIADLVGGFKLAMHQVSAGSDMFRPWHDELSEP
jgi:hypothetical protein